MPILSMNAAVWQMETPAGLPDAAYHTAFQVFSTCNPAKSECVFDRLLIKGCEIRWYFRPFTCAMRRMGNEKRRRRRSNHRFRSRETWQCDCYAGFSEGVSAVFVLIRRLISSLCCRL